MQYIVSIWQLVKYKSFLKKQKYYTTELLFSTVRLWSIVHSMSETHIFILVEFLTREMYKIRLLILISSVIWKLFRPFPKIFPQQARCFQNLYFRILAKQSNWSKKDNKIYIALAGTVPAITPKIMSRRNSSDERLFLLKWPNTFIDYLLFLRFFMYILFKKQQICHIDKCTGFQHRISAEWDP